MYYSLFPNGTVKQFDFYNELDFALTGEEPFSGLDIFNWRKLQTGEWIKIETPKIPYEWHVQERPIRVFISDESNRSLSILFPEFAVFRKQNSIPFFEVEEGSVIYLYDLEGFTNATNEPVSPDLIRYILETRNGCVFENRTEYESANTY